MPEPGSSTDRGDGEAAASPSPSASAAALPRLGRELWRGVRRASILLVAGVVLLLVAVPAVNDLEQLCRVLGGLLLLLGLLVVLATAYGTSSRQTSRRQRG